MNVRARLTQTEQLLAFLIGAGIVLAIVALMLAAFGTVDSNLTNSLLLVGIAFIVIGIIAWLVMVRPWEEFDDLQTPLYTGHHEPDAHAAPEVPAVPTGAAPVVTSAEAVEAAEPAEAAEAAEAAPATAAAEEPAAAEAAPIADDLTAISGIGPKTAEALASAGITSYAQVAAMSEDELAETARAHGARVGSAEGWPEQAQALLAAGPRQDLTLVEGIGPRSQEALYDAGITTYQALAAAPVERVQAILDEAELRLLDPATWPEQAAFLARGDADGLAAFQEGLKGGRRV